ncbi:MAG: hypothetical protein U1F15_09140 [Burkholderiales bacterium]
MLRTTGMLAMAVAMAWSRAGCSTRAWYGGLQAMAAGECNRRAPSDRDACAAQAHQMSYDQYQSARARAP